MTYRAAPAFEAVLRSLLPAPARLATWPGGDPPPLFPEELAAVARAVPTRAEEFARGRAAARRALDALGVPAGPIPVGDGREPLWPTGVVGSITHCEGLTAAVVARSSDLVGIGLDAEPARPLPEDVRAEVLGPSEVRGGALSETAVFCAKEAIHKALFPASRIWLGFLEVAVELDVDAGTFHAHPSGGSESVPPELARLEGRFLMGEHHVAAATWQWPGGVSPAGAVSPP